VFSLALWSTDIGSGSIDIETEVPYQYGIKFIYKATDVPSNCTSDAFSSFDNQDGFSMSLLPDSDQSPSENRLVLFNNSSNTLKLVVHAKPMASQSVTDTITYSVCFGEVSPTGQLITGKPGILVASDDTDHSLTPVPFDSGATTLSLPITVIVPEANRTGAPKASYKGSISLTLGVQ
jgi:hypothetical protein